MADSFSVGIIGAGTMGAGIAQVAAVAGWTVELKDVDEATARAAIDGIQTRLDRQVEKGRMSEADRAAAGERLLAATTAECLAGCDLVIEAIVEDLDVKAKVLSSIVPGLRDDAVIATNTSSLSVTEIGRAIGQARRTVGMHFFNPAPLMKLVEVIAGDESDPAIVDRVAEIARAWGKQVARARDVPGFIVNHVARPYYLEAFRILEDGLADPAQIDGTMKTLGGFRMGPLELTDLIGQDVNTATTRSVWMQLDKPPLLRPSCLQEHLASAGQLGRKSGQGVYRYGDEATTVAVEVERRSLELADPLRRAVDEFAERAVDGAGDPLQRYVLARILVAIIVQGALAHERGVADATDIDTALRYGVNYPRGPFEWVERIGPDVCARLLEQLNATASDGRFVIPETLKARV
jgi:3-hydroxybutyryl-CoA dehydrogenase